MSRTLNQIIRPFVPNITLRIPHIEPRTRLEVHLRQHLGLITRGARDYERRYVEVARHLVEPGHRVFDIGANIGFYSLAFSRWVGSSGCVLAYEPDSRNLKLLRRNLELNGCDNVEVRDVALGVTEREDEFSIDEVTGSTGHLGRGPTYGESLFRPGRESLTTVSVRTLDQEAELWGPPALIKLDVEGGEYDVITGGHKLLAEHRPFILSELSSWNHLETFGVDRAALTTKMLAELDYVLWDIDAGQVIEGGTTTWMILALPKERESEERVARALKAIRRNCTDQSDGKNT